MSSRIRKWGVNLAYVLDLRVGLYSRSRYLRHKRRDSKPLRRLDRVALLAAIPVACFVVWLVFFRQQFPVPGTLTRRHVTEHLEIHTDLSQADVEFHAAFFEQFIDRFQEEYFTFQPEQRLRMYLFATTDGYRAYVRPRRPHSLDDTGFYSPADNLILVNRESGLGTATHELVHYFIDRGFVQEPALWANEGIANFFEKFIGYIDRQGRLHVSFGYFQPQEFRFTKHMIDFVTLDDVINSDEQSLQRSLMMFLHKRGLFTPFVRELHANQDTTSAVETLVAVYAADLDVIEADWKNWVSSRPYDEDVTLVQAAFVKTEPEWDDWWRENSDRLYWDEGERIYRVRNPQLIDIE